VFAAVGCAGRGALPPKPAHALTTDSSHYSVRDTAGFYRAHIGYRYVNGSTSAVSIPGCQGPYPPALEKRVDGAWVRAYGAVLPLCEDVPPVRVRRGGRYEGVLLLDVAHKGRGSRSRSLEVDSLSGTYRLRWDVQEGPDAATRAPTTEVTSNEFQLRLYPR
jgi:hypothetical protein